MTTMTVQIEYQNDHGNDGVFTVDVEAESTEAAHELVFDRYQSKYDHLSVSCPTAERALRVHRSGVPGRLTDARGTEIAPDRAEELVERDGELSGVYFRQALQ